MKRLLVSNDSKNFMIIMKLYRLQIIMRDKTYNAMILC